MRANKSFDEKVRQYVANHHINHFREIDELTGRRCDNTVIHELFPGNDTRKRCFYVENCIYFLSPDSHDKIHKSFKIDLIIDLIAKRFDLKASDFGHRILLIDYYEKLRLLVNTFDIKKARYDWKLFFETDCVGEVPLVRLEL